MNPHVHWIHPSSPSPAPTAAHPKDRPPTVVVPGMIGLGPIGVSAADTTTTVTTKTYSGASLFAWAFLSSLITWGVVAGAVVYVMKETK